MTDSDIDYTRYTLEQLLSCQRNIDAARFPERAAQIELLIKDRLAQLQSQRPMAQDGRIASVKDGRAPSLGRGISQIVGGLIFGVVWLSVQGKAKNFPPEMAWVGYFAMASSVVSGLYHIYNAFAKNRFSASDIVAPGAEPDPFERLIFGDKQADKNADAIGVRRFEGDFCPFCGNKAERTDDFCSACGKDI